MKPQSKIITAICLLISLYSYSQPCTPSASALLDTNNIRALILNSSDKWHNVPAGTGQYEVPKGSGKMSMYDAAIWIGGYDASGILHLAAQTYRQTGNDFWAGPVQKNGCVVTVDTINCANYQHVWSYKKAEINNFISTGTATNDILTFPANGNVAAGELPLLAPFFDANSNGIYEPLLGDYPLMDVNNTIPDSVEQLFGDQSTYWIFNDTANTPIVTLAPTLGVEVHAQAFSFASPIPAVNNTTFYRYKIINRSCQTYDSVYISHWTDPDLGYYNDDYAGCHINKNLGYGYNGDIVDDLPDGYGLHPPAIGVTILQGPPADVNDGIDNNNNGIIDEQGEENLMTKFLVHNNDASFTGNPVTAQEYYNYMSGKWRDGTAWTYGGNGYNSGSTDSVNFILPGNSDPAHPVWDEMTVGNTPADRRFIISSGPFTFHSDQCVCLTYAVVWARDTSGNNLTSLDSLMTATDYIRNNFHYWDCPCNTPVGMEETDNLSSSWNIYPNPVSDKVTISSNLSVGKIELLNILGEVVYQSEINTAKAEINISSFDRGIYIIKVFTQKGMLQKKLVVSR